MLRPYFLSLLALSTLFFTSHSQAFESSNIQLLYSDQFDGDAFIYDTQNGHKTTLTLEHFRTWSGGDLFMFADLTQGKKFDGTKQEIYTEVSPRFSFSKLSGQALSTRWTKDFYLATQVNLGDGYEAYLAGVGVDLILPYFKFFSVNLYHKRDNFKNSTYQLTPAYQTQAFKNFHLEGFWDITEQNWQTHQQLLYNFQEAFSSTRPVYGGVEWIQYEHYTSHTLSNALQVMLKLQF